MPVRTEVVTDIAHAVWPGPGECPGDAIPTDYELGVWLPQCPGPAKAEADERLSATLGTDAQWTTIRLLLKSEGLTGPLMAVFDASVITIGEVDSMWRQIDHDRQPKHPVAPIIAAWQARARAAEPFALTRRASLPRIQQITTEEVRRLPELPGREHEDPDAPLPGFETETTACPSWLLWLYDRAGGKTMSAGGRAPWELHLFVGAMLHLNVADRDGQWRTLRFPHLVRHEADWPRPGTPSIERWLFPDGWANLRRDWDKLPEALHRLEAVGRIPIGGYSVRILSASAIPLTRDMPTVEFSARIPSAAATGARTDWQLLCGYRPQSAAVYRAYLSACAYLDRSAHRGHAVTAEIGAPVLLPDGRPKRRKGGSIVRSARLVPNPAARYVSGLTDADLARMIGLDSTVRQYRINARRAFEHLHRDGVIDLHRRGRKLYVFGPRTPKS